MSVLLVLTNYARPANLPTCIEAWHAQTVKPDRLVVVDNAPGVGTELYPRPELAGADDVWRWRTNSGCPCRFAPALLDTHHDYVLFADDDFVPGKRALKHVLRAAEVLHDRFSTLGQVGRNFRLGAQAGSRYVYGDVARSIMPAVCHLTCRVHLVRTQLLHHMLEFRAKLIDSFNNAARYLSGIHDDFLLCLGLQMGTGLPSYVIPHGRDADDDLIRRNLDQTGAVYMRPKHLAERNEFVDMAVTMGWKPCA